MKTKRIYELKEIIGKIIHGFHIDGEYLILFFEDGAMIELRAVRCFSDLEIEVSKDD